MLKFLNSNQSNFLSKLEKILSKRSTQNFNNSFLVKKIIGDIEKSGDQAVIKYE
jgi:histidinol dehydrogenase